MKDISRFGVSLPTSLLRDFDGFIAHKDYASRSEAIADLMRDYLAREAWKTGKAVAVGTITVVYDHHVPELQHKLTAIQHDCAGLVLSTLHIHLDHDRCLEVLVVKGKTSLLRTLADRLEGTRGVTYSKLTLVSPP